MGLTEASLWVVISEIQNNDKIILSQFNHESRFSGSRRLNEWDGVGIQFRVIDDLIDSHPESDSATSIGAREGIEHS